MNLTAADFPEFLNLAGFLSESNLSAGRKDKVAFYSLHRSLTYGRLFEDVARFSEYLGSFGISAKERIVILLPDSCELIISFLGAVWQGVIPVLINEAASLEDIDYMLGDCQCMAVISTNEWKNKLAGFYNSKNRPWIIIDDQTSPFEQLENFQGAILPARTARNEPAFWVYTSGSTGKPKAVMHAHYSPIVAAERYAKETLKLTENDIIYSAPPMAFSYGLGTTLYFPLCLGASAVISEVTDAFGFIEVLNTYKPTVFFGIPDNFANILALKDIAPLILGHLRLCVSAGEQLPSVLWEKWQEQYKLSICEGIGATETTHIFISNTPEGGCIPGSTGKPVPGYTIELVDEQDNLVNLGEVGLLKVIADGLMLGYWNKEMETRIALPAPTIFVTGDYYYRDALGNYYFVGRKSHSVKIKGMWVIPSEVEDIILDLEAVREVAIIVGRNNIVNEVSELWAAICLREGFNSKEDALKEIKIQLTKNLAKHKQPKKFYFLDKLPRTSTGKIDRKKLSEMFLKPSKGEKQYEEI